MDFVWAMCYPFRGKRWYLRLPLTLVLLIPIAGIVIGFGYVISIIRHITEGDYDLPQLRLHIAEGFYSVGSAVGHFGAASIIAVPVDMFLRFRFRPQGGAETNLVMLVDLMVVLPFALTFFIGMIRYALTDDPHTLLDVKKNVQIVWHNRWHILQSLIHASVFALGTGCAVVSLYNIPDPENQTPFFQPLVFQSSILTIVFLIMLIGLPMCGTGYLLGQLARRLDLSESGEKLKNDKIKPSMI